ncbi:potassium transporter TrkG [Francisella noatunensis]
MPKKNAYPYILSFAVTFSCGFLFWFISTNTQKKLSNRDGFLIVTLVWMFVTVFGAIPYMSFPGLNLSFTDAVFESVSGFTTTGGTVIEGLDKLPHSILFYRQQTEFFGGMGIIVLSVARVTTFPGVGGMQLYKAEISGQWKDDKIAPKISSYCQSSMASIFIANILMLYFLFIGWCRSF